jgi:DNA-binding NarL/FixJ family response regulator
MTSGIVMDRNQPISLLLIEDNPLLRQGLVALIREQPDFAVLDAPRNVDRALKKVREAKPRVVLLDCGLAEHDSVQLTAMVHHERPEARIVGMGLLPLQEDVTDFVRAGASGFVMKNAPMTEVLTTIRSVARGVDVVPPQLSLSALSQIALEAPLGGRPRMLDAVRLTSRELQVIGLAGDGQSNQEIASRLDIPLHTVKSHMQNLLEKLALRTRLEMDLPDAPTRPSRAVVLQS